MLSSSFFHKSFFILFIEVFGLVNHISLSSTFSLIFKLKPKCAFIIFFYFSIIDFYIIFKRLDAKKMRKKIDGLNLFFN